MAVSGAPPATVTEATEPPQHRELTTMVRLAVVRVRRDGSEHVCPVGRSPHPEAAMVELKGSSGR